MSFLDNSLSFLHNELSFFDNSLSFLHGEVSFFDNLLWFLHGEGGDEVGDWRVHLKYTVTMTKEQNMIIVSESDDKVSILITQELIDKISSNSIGELVTISKDDLITEAELKNVNDYIELLAVGKEDEITLTDKEVRFAKEYFR